MWIWVFTVSHMCVQLTCMCAHIHAHTHTHSHLPSASASGGNKLGFQTVLGYSRGGWLSLRVTWGRTPVCFYLQVSQCHVPRLQGPQNRAKVSPACGPACVSLNICTFNIILAGKLGRDEISRGWRYVEEDNLSRTRDFRNWLQDKYHHPSLPSTPKLNVSFPLHPGKRESWISLVTEVPRIQLSWGRGSIPCMNVNINVM